MNYNSHRMVASFLSCTFLRHSRTVHKKLFYIGCIIPDKNPATYLKGSFRHKLFHGHHWHNASDYIEKLSNTLEKRDHFRTLDYYTLGKLIHYIADAFTYPHNSHFLGNLAEHKNYEFLLEPCIKDRCAFALTIPEFDCSLNEFIRSNRLTYILTGSDIQTDAVYIHNICSEILLHLYNKTL